MTRSILRFDVKIVDCKFIGTDKITTTFIIENIGKTVKFYYLNNINKYDHFTYVQTIQTL